MTHNPDDFVTYWDCSNCNHSNKTRHVLVEKKSISFSATVYYTTLASLADRAIEKFYDFRAPDTANCDNCGAKTAL